MDESTNRGRRAYTCIILAVILLMAALGGCARKQDPTRAPGSTASAKATKAMAADAPAATATADPGLPDVGTLFAPTPPPPSLFRPDWRLAQQHCPPIWLHHG